MTNLEGRSPAFGGAIGRSDFPVAIKEKREGRCNLPVVKR